MTIKAEAILLSAGVLDPTGNVYTVEALQRLAERFPKKLQYRDGHLICLVEFENDQHRSRMMHSLTYHAEQQAEEYDHSELAEKCENRSVEQTDGGFRLYCWHPQWGGYVGCAEVEFSQYSGDNHQGPGCFELAVYHDGDFSTGQIEFKRHCCAADQFIRFGLNVLEAQMDHQSGLDGKPVRFDAMDRTRLEEFRDRISRLLIR